MLFLAGLLLLSGCAAENTGIQTQQKVVNTAESSPTPPSESLTQFTTSPAPLPKPSAETKESGPVSLQGVTDYAQAYADTINQWEKETEGLTYDLIYFDEDEIPELVVGHTGYWVSMYTYSAGTLYTVMDGWGYGAMGNHGYEYIPYGNVVLNYNGDLAGAIMWEFYGRMNDSHEIESCYEESLSMWMFKDANHNHQIDEGEWQEGEQYYYYGENELTAEKYDSFLIPGDYQPLEGEKTASEIAVQLQMLLDTDAK